MMLFSVLFSEKRRRYDIIRNDSVKIFISVPYYYCWCAILKKFTSRKEEERLNTWNGEAGGESWPTVWKTSAPPATTVGLTEEVACTAAYMHHYSCPALLPPSTPVPSCGRACCASCMHYMPVLPAALYVLQHAALFYLPACRPCRRGETDAFCSLAAASPATAPVSRVAFFITCTLTTCSVFCCWLTTVSSWYIHLLFLMDRSSLNRSLEKMTMSPL